MSRVIAQITPTYHEKVPQEVKDYLRALVAAHYPGRKGGKTEENFAQNVIAYVGFLARRARINRAERVPGEFQYAVPVSREDERNMPTIAGVKNPQKVRQFLLDQRVLSIMRDVLGRDYSRRGVTTFCRRYRVNLHNFPFWS